MHSRMTLPLAIGLLSISASVAAGNALQLVPIERPASVQARALKDQSRVLPTGVLPDDGRLGKPRTLRDPYHPWAPPNDLGSWETRKTALKQQLLVANGLWPLPEKTPLNPVIHGKIDKGEYTIEKVYLESYPGHFVTGNLYRPIGRKGKLPAVLSPHGHWQNGRFYDAGEKEAQKQIGLKAEQFLANARYVLQARMASLARMGCVVFHYDMTGVADSTVIPHGAGFADTQAMLRLQSAMGLQTWNTIRAYDFLESLEDVDPKRIGVSGASGGGTQTFILCALDPRPAAGFPAVMVSSDMQGGCVCENCPLLRVGTTNVEFGALFAPKPYGMTAADDWTRNMETKGYPELKAIYSLYGVPENVMLAPFLQFGHNYNQVSREVMYSWMNRHLDLGIANVAERPIDPVPPKELSVFSDEHPLPQSAKDITELRRYLTETSEAMLQEIGPQSPSDLQTYRHVVGSALEAMVADSFPAASEIEIKDLGSKRISGARIDRLLLSRAEAPTLPREAIPTAAFFPEEWNGRMVVAIDSEGHASLMDESTGLPGPTLRALLEQSYAVLAPDVYLTGEFHATDRYTQPERPDLMYAGYTFCYNRTPLANRVHDILTAVGCAKHLYNATSIDLVGSGEAGPWVVLARGLCGDAVRRTVADCQDFSFHNVKLPSDPMFLPGSLKYGDLIGLAGLTAPGELFLAGFDSYRYGDVERLKRIFELAGNPAGLVLDSEAEERERRIRAWLTR